MSELSALEGCGVWISFECEDWFEIDERKFTDYRIFYWSADVYHLFTFDPNNINYYYLDPEGYLHLFRLRI
jgi:hypothetical protein